MSFKDPTWKKRSKKGDKKWKSRHHTLAPDDIVETWPFASGTGLDGRMSIDIESSYI
jgi:hypothetical protein